MRYYHRAPGYFHGWNRDEPPHWGEHWGPGWEGRHQDWEHWDNHHVPRPAPLPDYQRTYRGDRYPHAEQQLAVHRQNCHYEHQDPVVRERMHSARPENDHGHDHVR